MGAPQQQQKTGGKDPQQLRDGRDQQKQDGTQAGQQPKDGPNGERRDGSTRPDDGDTENPKRDDGVQGWMARLPAEVRDAMAGGSWEKIPARYRKLLERYTLWMQKNKAKQAEDRNR